MIQKQIRGASNQMHGQFKRWNSRITEKGNAPHWPCLKVKILSEVWCPYESGTEGKPISQKPLSQLSELHIRSLENQGRLLYPYVPLDIHAREYPVQTAVNIVSDMTHKARRIWSVSNHDGTDLLLVQAIAIAVSIRKA
jgi:hypothetical protein